MGEEVGQSSAGLVTPILRSRQGPRVDEGQRTGCSIAQELMTYREVDPIESADLKKKSVLINFTGEKTSGVKKKLIIFSISGQIWDIMFSSVK